ncbi:hypothetical protein L798_08541 [Zootermopsis nevadensis]|uniref:Uncharacterized protein n=1 Tax=Zootermopsis nevadensis TaxID=136037 RepID=A0A067REN3_ZOONE|nr:hypothetical protein L798_08541 [Zootermopsis nevadensis]
MGRATLLVLASICLVLVAHGQEVTQCDDVKCPWMEEQICPGEFIPQEPSIGRCCSTCVVTVEGGQSCTSAHPGFQIDCRNPYNCQDGVCSE